MNRRPSARTVIAWCACRGHALRCWAKEHFRVTSDQECRLLPHVGHEQCGAHTSHELPATSYRLVSVDERAATAPRPRVWRTYLLFDWIHPVYLSRRRLSDRLMTLRECHPTSLRIQDATRATLLRCAWDDGSTR